MSANEDHLIKRVGSLITDNSLINITTLKNKKGEFLHEQFKNHKHYNHLYQDGVYRMDMYVSGSVQGLQFSVIFPNNIIVPIVKIPEQLDKALEELKYDKNPEYIYIMETYTFSNTNQLESFLDYYQNVDIDIKVKEELKREILKDLMDISKGGLIETRYGNGYERKTKLRLLTVLNVNLFKNRKMVYVPHLNIAILNGKPNSKTVHPAYHNYKYGDANTFFTKKKKEFGIDFKIINNENPGKTYYTKIFDKVVKIESETSPIEESCFTYKICHDDIELYSKNENNIDELGKFNIYDTYKDCVEDNESLKLEKKKMDLEFKKLESTDKKLEIDMEVHKVKTKLEIHKLVFDFRKMTSEHMLNKYKFHAEIKKMKRLEKEDNFLDKIISATNNVSKVASITKVLNIF